MHSAIKTDFRKLMALLLGFLSLRFPLLPTPFLIASTAEKRQILQPKGRECSVQLQHRPAAAEQLRGDSSDTIWGQAGALQGPSFPLPTRPRKPQGLALAEPQCEWVVRPQRQRLWRLLSLLVKTWGRLCEIGRRGVCKLGFFLPPPAVHKACSLSEAPPLPC